MRGAPRVAKKNAQMPLSPADPRERITRLLDRLTVVPDGSVEAFVAGIGSTPGPFVISFVNAHAVNLACEDDAFFESLVESDLLLRDGKGMKILCEAVGVDPGVNMNGTDLIPRLLERYRGRRIALCGTRDPFLAQAAEQVDAPVLVLDGFQPIEDYGPAVKEARPDLVVLGMGMPKQEQVARELKRTLATDIVVVNGGAILDFMAGRFSRAPRWVRGAGLEWAYRLAKEPRRLFARYVIGNAVFLSRVVALRRQR